MATLRPEPGLYDVEGWRQLVEDLRAAPPEEVSPTFLFCAEAHLETISKLPQKTASEAV